MREKKMNESREVGGFGRTGQGRLVLQARATPVEPARRTCMGADSADPHMALMALFHLTLFHPLTAPHSP